MQLVRYSFYSCASFPSQRSLRTSYYYSFQSKSAWESARTRLNLGQFKRVDDLPKTEEVAYLGIIAITGGTRNDLELYKEGQEYI